MKVIRSKIFEQFPELIFGISAKTGFNRKAPFYFNMSLTVGDNPADVWENRTRFIEALGLKKDDVAFQKQIHSDIITVVDVPSFIGESDAMITARKSVGLAISTADCTPVFIYDKEKQVIAGIHSGWRGTEKRIVEKTLSRMFSDFGSRPENLFAYIGPSISKANYEVGEEVAALFAPKYFTETSPGKFLLDVKRMNYDFLINAGIPKENIQLSNVCSFENSDMHSYRRDKENSGRALGIIAMKGTNETGKY